MYKDPEIKTINLYPYQQNAVSKIFETLTTIEKGENILFQLPTGGGKTVIFSDITKKYLEELKRKVLILTHRVELMKQTSKALNDVQVNNKLIDRYVRSLDDQADYPCFVAMVETLNNRLNENSNYIEDIGLVIVDEAHYNSFRKIFQHFKKATILGVTATPLSSNKNLPLKDNYKHLIVGESIASLIKDQYLSKATTYCYDVNLGGLKVGINGDYTVGSSERLYGTDFMVGKLLAAYKEQAVGTKTLIYNAGIATSWQVFHTFKNAGIEIKHLDSTFGDVERREILEWFKTKPDSVITSVGILTTGFDEPGIETIILNRATRSLTLYHQMIGRGSRIIPGKSEFKVIDLGNNALRLGMWEDYIDWNYVFKHPDDFIQTIAERDKQNQLIPYEMPPEIQERFENSDLDLKFSVLDAYEECVSKGIKPKQVMELSIENHHQKIRENASTNYEGLELMELLQDDIKYRVKEYASCIKGTENYVKWQIETYNQKLKQKVRMSLLDG